MLPLELNIVVQVRTLFNGALIYMSVSSVDCASLQAASGLTTLGSMIKRRIQRTSFRCGASTLVLSMSYGHISLHVDADRPMLLYLDWTSQQINPPSK